MQMEFPFPVPVMSLRASPVSGMLLTQPCHVFDKLKLFKTLPYWQPFDKLVQGNIFQYHFSSLCTQVLLCLLSACTQILLKKPVETSFSRAFSNLCPLSSCFHHCHGNMTVQAARSASLLPSFHRCRHSETFSADLHVTHVVRAVKLITAIRRACLPWTDYDIHSYGVWKQFAMFRTTFNCLN